MKSFVFALFALAFAADRVADISFKHSDIGVSSMMCLHNSAKYSSLVISVLEHNQQNPKLGALVMAAAMSGYGLETIGFSGTISTQVSAAVFRSDDVKEAGQKAYFIVDGEEKWADAESNCKIMKAVIANCTAQGKTTCDIGSNAASWTKVFGSADACAEFPKSKLWWLQPDGSESIENFRPFGGFTAESVVMKQVDASRSVCGTLVGDNVIVKA